MGQLSPDEAICSRFVPEGVEVITADHSPVLLPASNTRFPLLGANDTGVGGDQTHATLGFGLPKEFDDDSAIVNALKAPDELF